MTVSKLILMTILKALHIIAALRSIQAGCKIMIWFDNGISIFKCYLMSNPFLLTNDNGTG